VHLFEGDCPTFPLIFSPAGRPEETGRPVPASLLERTIGIRRSSSRPASFCIGEGVPERMSRLLPRPWFSTSHSFLEPVSRSASHVAFIDPFTASFQASFCCLPLSDSCLFLPSTIVLSLLLSSSLSTADTSHRHHHHHHPPPPPFPHCEPSSRKSRSAQWGDGEKERKERKRKSVEVQVSPHGTSTPSFCFWLFFFSSSSSECVDV
jgi:hypothetical protein